MEVKEAAYVTLGNSKRTHRVPPPYEGTHALCGVFIPMGAGASSRNTLWRVQPCPECADALRRKP